MSWKSRSLVIVLAIISLSTYVIVGNYIIINMLISGTSDCYDMQPSTMIESLNDYYQSVYDLFDDKKKVHNKIYSSFLLSALFSISIQAQYVAFCYSKCTYCYQISRHKRGMTLKALLKLTFV